MSRPCPQCALALGDSVSICPRCGAKTRPPEPPPPPILEPGTAPAARTTGGAGDIGEKAVKMGLTVLVIAVAAGLGIALKKHGAATIGISAAAVYIVKEIWSW